MSARTLLVGPLLAVMAPFWPGCGSPPPPSPKPGTGTDTQPAGAGVAAEDKPSLEGKADAGGKAGLDQKPTMGAVQTEHYIVDGEEFFCKALAPRIDSSPLWQRYIEQRGKDPNAKKPFVRFGVFSERHAEDSRGVVYTTIDINLSVTDLATQKRFWIDKLAEGMSHHTLNAKFQYEELMRRIPKSENLDHLVDRAGCMALCLQGKENMPLVLETFKRRPDYLTGAFVESLMKQDAQMPVALAVLTQGLKSTDKALHNASLDYVLKMKLDSEEAVPILSQLLKHYDGNLRIRAVENLARIGAPAAEPLMDALLDESVQARQKAEVALLQLGPNCPQVKASLPHLIELAGNAKGQPRRLVLRALSELGREDGQATFANALMDDDPWIPENVTKYLLPLGPKNKAILPELKAALIGPNRGTRFGVLEVLKAIGPDARDVIALALHDIGPKVRLDAAMALADMGPEGVELLLPFANHEDKYVRGVVASAKLKHPQAGKKTPAKKTDDQKTVATPPETAEPDKTADGKKDEKKKEPPKLVTLKDGRKITAEKVVDFGDSYSVKTSAGKFMTIPKTDVERIEAAGEQ